VIRAVNTAADSENKIHDDRIAAAYGFRGGLVPGVTVYGYLASAVIEHFGHSWLDRGAMDVRFHQPIYEGDEVIVTSHVADDGRVCVEAGPCATGVAWIAGTTPPAHEYAERPIRRRPASAEALAAGTVLGTLIERIDLHIAKMSAPLDASIDGFAHPAILLALANKVLVENVILGPWIHVSSEVRKFRAVRDGEELRVRAKVEDRYERKGHEFVVLDVLMLADEPVEHVRHTAIWKPRVTR
jgi:acyl dehydratase